MPKARNICKINIKLFSVVTVWTDQTKCKQTFGELSSQFPRSKIQKQKKGKIAEMKTWRKREQEPEREGDRLSEWEQKGMRKCKRTSLKWMSYIMGWYAFGHFKLNAQCTQVAMRSFCNCIRIPNDLIFFYQAPRVHASSQKYTPKTVKKKKTQTRGVQRHPSNIIIIAFHHTTLKLSICS